MSLEQHDNNTITKSEDDRVRLYLKNVFQRYFEREKEYSLQTREAIIIQAFTRLKEAINAKHKSDQGFDFMLCVNEKSGVVYLDITDLHGEPAFDKRTAYNKDFCNYNPDIPEQDQPDFTDTIVRGNDTRLYDERIPLAHVHKIEEFDGLKEILDEAASIDSHVHQNLDILKLIKYTGNKINLDLAILDEFSMSAENMISHFSVQDNYAYNIAERVKNGFDGALKPLQNELQYIKNKIFSLTEDVKEDVYGKNLSASFEERLRELFSNYLTKEDFNVLRAYLEKVPYIISEGNITHDEFFEIDDIQETPNDDIKFYVEQDGNSILLNNGCTDIYLHGNIEFTIPDNDLKDVKNQNLINTAQKIFIKYNKNGEQQIEKLPTIIQANDSKDDLIAISYKVSSKNKITILMKRFSRLDYCINRGLSIMFNAHDNDADSFGYAYVSAVAGYSNSNSYLIKPMKEYTNEYASLTGSGDFGFSNGSESRLSISSAMALIQEHDDEYNITVDNCTYNIALGINDPNDTKIYDFRVFYQNADNDQYSTDWRFLGAGKVRNKTVTLDDRYIDKNEDYIKYDMISSNAMGIDEQKQWLILNVPISECSPVKPEVSITCDKVEDFSEEYTINAKYRASSIRARFLLQIATGGTYLNIDTDNNILYDFSKGNALYEKDYIIVTNFKNKTCTPKLFTSGGYELTTNNEYLKILSTTPTDHPNENYKEITYKVKFNRPKDRIVMMHRTKEYDTYEEWMGNIAGKAYVPYNVTWKPIDNYNDMIYIKTDNKEEEGDTSDSYTVLYNNESHDIWLSDTISYWNSDISTHIQDKLSTYKIGRLSDILDGAEFHYQVFNVPGKGDLE